MEKSRRYDWFREGPNSPKTPQQKAKRTAKITWRVTKIFVIFFILFVSLWGCGQNFAIPQDINVARSIEIYSSESNVPPHVTQFKQTATTVKKAGADLTVNSLQVNSKNIWLPNYSDDGREAMSLVQNEIKTQNPSGNLKMSDADGGVNEVVSVIDSSDKLLNNRAVAFVDNKPLALSSAASSVTYNTATGQGLNFILNDLIKDQKLLILSSSAIAQNTAVQTARVWSSTPTGFPNDITLTNNYTASQVARSAFRDRVFNYLNNVGKPNWIIDALTLKNDYSFPVGQSTTGEFAGLYSAVIAAQNNALQVLSYLGYTVGTVTLSAANPDAMPGLYGATYIPIVTWDQAFVRGTGPFYGLFVYPVSQLQIAILDAMPFMSGWESFIGIAVLVFVLRIAAFLLSFKSTMQQTKMDEVRLKKASIDAKYAAFKGNKQMTQRKNQEVQELYRKEGIKPSAAFIGIVVSIPIFITTWRVIASTPQLKATTWLGINFAATSWRELFSGNFLYLPILVVSLGMSLFTSFFPRFLTNRRNKLRSDAHLRAAMKKSDRTQIIIMIVVALFSVILNAGVQVYSIIGGVWIIIQTLITHKIILERRKRQKVKAAVR